MVKYSIMLGLFCKWKLKRNNFLKSKVITLKRNNFFEKVVNFLRASLKNISIFLTGSNSKMLSEEFTNEVDIKNYLYSVYDSVILRDVVKRLNLKDTILFDMILQYLIETTESKFGVYNDILDNYPKYVISLDKVDLSRNGVIHLNLIDFLLNEEW